MAFRLRLLRRKTKKTKGVLANEQSGFSVSKAGKSESKVSGVGYIDEKVYISLA